MIKETQIVQAADDQPRKNDGDRERRNAVRDEYPEVHPDVRDRVPGHERAYEVDGAGDGEDLGPERRWTASRRGRTRPRGEWA